MSHLARFGAYAAAFERAFESDDWNEVGEFFAEDAVYEVGLPMLGASRVEGRAAILAWFREVLDRLDRRFATRELTLLEGPKEEGDRVWLRGTATYTAEGVPDFVLELEETLHFRDGLITTLEDTYTPEATAALVDYLAAHGAGLGIEVPGDDRA